MDFKVHDFNAKFMLLFSLCQDNRDQEGTVLVPKKLSVQEQGNMNAPKLQSGEDRNNGCMCRS